MKLFLTLLSVAISISVFADTKEYSWTAPTTDVNGVALQGVDGYHFTVVQDGVKTIDEELAGDTLSYTVDLLPAEAVVYVSAISQGREGEASVLSEVAAPTAPGAITGTRTTITTTTTTVIETE